MHVEFVAQRLAWEGVPMPRLLADAGVQGPALAAVLAELRAELAPWLEQGLLLMEGPRWRLSDPAGLALSNGVLRELLAWWQEQPQAPGWDGAGPRSSGATPPPPESGPAAAAG